MTMAGNETANQSVDSTTIIEEEHLPLLGLRVLDLTDGKGSAAARYLADLGAEVVLVEPPEGVLCRSRAPLHDGESLYFHSRNANKLSVALDLDSESGKRDFYALLAAANIVIASRDNPIFQSLDATPQQLSAQHPHLTVLSVSDFGESGPYKDFQATNSTLMAMCGMTARSGLKGRDPLLPPGSHLAFEAASIQASWCVLLSYWQSLEAGRGGFMDFGVFEATAQILDPGLGVTGSAAGGKSARDLAPRGRPPAGKGYPIFPCADGFVRICVLNPRQWHGMCEWLGDDHPYTDPSFAKMSVRFKHMRDINVLIGDLFASERASDLVREGQLRGVPIAAVARPGDVFANPHFIARKTFSDLPIGKSAIGKIPTGYVEVDDQQCGVRRGAPSVGSDNDYVIHRWKHPGTVDTASEAKKSSRLPLSDLRVLDLGVIVAGAELGRLFADQGADVIKIENHKFADGLRQSLTNEPMTVSFAQGSRGKRSLGLNLRSNTGRALFKQLVEKADVVISNFKPGTMEKMGLGYEILREINPRLIVAESSALGSHGPDSQTMGYGPLVRSTTGLTGLWRYPDDETGFSDAVTIVPDHFAARASAVAILAALINRRRSQQGARITLSQAEAILSALSEDFLRESLEPGALQPRGNVGEFDAPDSLFPCAGDDEWCAVSVRDSDDWERLCNAMNRDDLKGDTRFKDSQSRLKNREILEEAVGQWTKSRTPWAVTETLQNAGVPAGFMQRLDEYEDNPHFVARNFFRLLEQPGIEGALLTENGPIGVSHLAEPVLKPAPFLAEHTREIATELLGLSDSQIATLVAAGDLELSEIGSD